MIKKILGAIAMALLVCTFAHADTWTKIAQRSDEHQLFVRLDSVEFFEIKGERWKAMLFMQKNKDRITPDLKYAVSGATCRKGSGPLATWQIIDGQWQRLKSYSWRNDLYTLEDEAVDRLCSGLVPESERPERELTFTDY